MIDRIDDNNLLNTQSTLQNQETQSTQSITNNALKGAYGAKSGNLVDESDISQEAVYLYQREQEINRYTGYLDDISEEEATREVVELMEKGIIDISEEELAESMFNNIAVLNDLFSPQ